MNRTTRLHRLLRCLPLLAALSAGPALAQQAPVGDNTVLPSPSALEAPPAAPNNGPFAPPAPPPPTAENLWGILQDWPWLPRTFFADTEIDVLKPHLKGALIGPVTLSNGASDLVHPPTAPLDWTAAPRFEVGWFLPPSLGYFAFSWRGFADDGREIVTGLDNTPYALRTRLDLNQIAFDYGTVPYSFAPRFFVSGRLGMAAAWVFFDNQADNAVRGFDASNDFWGAGPHLRLDVWREFNLLPGLALFAQPDLMVLVGRIQQHYRQSESVDGRTIAGSNFLRRTGTVPVFTLRAGLSYTPASLSRWRFLLGYEFEDWGSVGQAPGTSSQGQFYTNGIFLRAVVTF